MRRYRALLVGNWHYPDDPANLPDLKGPMNDVSRLAEALADPGIGLFAPADVVTLTERASHEIVAELESFFGDATRDDVLLLYYSGHGITSDSGALLLCGRNARTDRRLATTVSADTVNQMITACPAAAVIIMLDCCHAGAFKSGGIADDLGGKGRFVLTASRARDRAPDAEHATGLSRFTGHLLRGIQGGAALPGAEHITLSDVYRYIHRRMTEDGPVIPQRRFDGDGEVAIARHHPAATDTGAAPSLQVSETAIELGVVRIGEILPVERIQVTARKSDGTPAPWWAETEADWIFVQSRPHHVDIRITPRAGATRANIHIRHSVTGDIRTVRVTATPVPAEPDWLTGSVAASFAGAGATGATTLGELGDAVPVRQSDAPIPSARATGVASVPAGAARTDVPAGAAGAGVPAGAAGVPAVAGGPAPGSAAMRDLLADTMTGTPVDRLVKGPLVRTRAESVARRTAAVSDAEATVGALDLQGNGYVLFTDRAVYWTNQGQTVAVGYRQFAGRTFALRAPSHVDFGDGVPRLIGPRAPQLAALLTALRAHLTA